MIKQFLRRLTHIMRLRRFDGDLLEEMQLHLDLRQAELRKAGLSSANARSQARRNFGGILRVQEESRETWGWNTVETLAQNLRYALRQSIDNPGFTLITVLTLALGIGANTALFSVVNTLLLRELPYKDASNLVYVTEYWPHEPVVPGPPSPDYANWRAHAQLADHIAAYGGGAAALTLTGGGEPERIQGTMVTAQFLDLIGVRLALGRNFTAQEDVSGGTPAVILSHRLWQRRFGSSPEVIGKLIELDGTSRMIVGVLPTDFVFPDNNFSDEFLVPMALPPDPNWGDGRNFRLLRVIAHLKKGATSEGLLSELAAILRSTAAMEPPQIVTMRRDMEIRITPLRQWISGDVRLIVLVLQASVAFVLLICCLKVANLQIARSISRRKEMALRAALGAGRGRITGQLLTESLLYAFAGAGSGVLLGYFGLKHVRAFLPANLHLADAIRIDATVLAFTVSIAAIAGVVTCLAPILAISRIELNETLKEGTSRTTQTGSHHRLHGALVIAEVALAIVLLAGAGLLIRTFLHLTSLDPGFDRNGVLTLRMSVPLRKYPNEEAVTGFYSQVLEKAAAIPGVQHAAVSSGLPVTGTYGAAGMSLQGGPPVPPGGRPSIPVATVSTDYFRAMGIPILRGRGFAETNREHAPLVAIVNQAFADKFFGGENPLGKRIEVGTRDGSWREIVGIAGNVRQQGQRLVDPFIIYLPYRQFSSREMVLVLKSGLGAKTLTAAARNGVQSVDPNQPVYDAATMEERLSDSLSAQRANMVLMGIFAAMAFLLAAIGIFGILSYFVSRRSHEIGIRLALGARPGDVTKMVLTHGMTLTAAGIFIGLLGALAAMRILRTLLAGVSPNDPVTLVAVPVLFAGIAAAACLIPARRAARVDPLVSLRHE